MPLSRKPIVAALAALIVVTMPAVWMLASASQEQPRRRIMRGGPDEGPKAQGGSVWARSGDADVTVAFTLPSADRA